MLSGTVISVTSLILDHVNKSAAGQVDGFHLVRSIVKSQSEVEVGDGGNCGLNIVSTFEKNFNFS